MKNSQKLYENIMRDVRDVFQQRLNESDDDYWRREWNERLTAGQDLVDEIQDAGYKVFFNRDYTIILWHGTAPETADIIRREGLERQSYLSATKKESLGHVAAKRKNNVFLKLSVDARDISWSSGTNEFYAEDGLVPGRDGVWCSPQRKEEQESH